MRAKLPANATPILGPDGSGVGHVFWYTVEGKTYDLATLRSIQDWYLRDKLVSVEGVAEIASIGGFVKQYQVDIHPFKMRAYNVAVKEVASAIQRNNNEVGGKLLEISDAEYFVRGQGYITSIADVENQFVKLGPNGIPILVKNVATVQLGGDIRRGLLEKDGEGEVVGGIVVMRNGANARDVTGPVTAQCPQTAHAPGTNGAASVLRAAAAETR